MQFIHCEIYQGAIAAAHIEFSSRELYDSSETEGVPQVISPVVIDQIGDADFLQPVATVEEAITAAKTRIEQRNSSYMSHVIEDRIPGNNAVQHFKDCGIPLESLPPIVIERPYFP